MLGKWFKKLVTSEKSPNWKNDFFEIMPKFFEISGKLSGMNVVKVLRKFLKNFR